MVEVKTAFKFLDVFWSLICGYISIDVIPLIDKGISYSFSEVDNAIKISLAFAGLIYFVLRIINYGFTSYINYMIKKEELNKIIQKNKEFDLNIKVAERIMPPAQRVTPRVEE